MDPITAALFSLGGSALGKGIDWLSNMFAGNKAEKDLNSILKSEMGQKMFIEAPDLSPIYQSEKQNIGQTMANKKAVGMGRVSGMGYNPLQEALIGAEYDQDLLGAFSTLAEDHATKQSQADYEANAYNAQVYQSIVDQLMKAKSIGTSTGINLGSGLINNFSSILGALSPKA